MKLAFETDQGIGARATFGLIVLQADETLENEFARMAALDGVASHFTRIPMANEVRTDTLAKMLDDLPAAAGLLPVTAPFDVIGYGCTSASSVIGPERVAAAVQSVLPNAKVTNPLSALIAAANSLGAKRLGFVTPYVPEVSARMRDRLEEAGFSIAGFGSFEEGDDRVVARITEDSIRAAAIRVAQSQPCDAVVIACTNLRCLRVIPEIEQGTGIPALSSNQAMGWHMLRLAGIDDPAPQFGQLFTKGLKP